MSLANFLFIWTEITGIVRTWKDRSQIYVINTRRNVNIKLIIIIVCISNKAVIVIVVKLIETLLVDCSIYIAIVH